MYSRTSVSANVDIARSGLSSSVLERERQIRSESRQRRRCESSFTRIEQRIEHNAKDVTLVVFLLFYAFRRRLELRLSSEASVASERYDSTLAGYKQSRSSSVISARRSRRDSTAPTATGQFDCTYGSNTEQQQSTWSPERTRHTVQGSKLEQPVSPLLREELLQKRRQQQSSSTKLLHLLTSAERDEQVLLQEQLDYAMFFSPPPPDARLGVSEEGLAAEGAEPTSRLMRPIGIADGSAERQSNYLQHTSSLSASPLHEQQLRPEDADFARERLQQWDGRNGANGAYSGHCFNTPYDLPAGVLITTPCDPPAAMLFNTPYDPPAQLNDVDDYQGDGAEAMHTPSTIAGSPWHTGSASTPHSASAEYYAASRRVSQRDASPPRRERGASAARSYSQLRADPVHTSSYASTAAAPTLSSMASSRNGTSSVLHHFSTPIRGTSAANAQMAVPSSSTSISASRPLTGSHVRVHGTQNRRGSNNDVHIIASPLIAPPPVVHREDSSYAGKAPPAPFHSSQLDDVVTSTTRMRVSKSGAAGSRAWTSAQPRELDEEREIRREIAQLDAHLERALSVSSSSSVMAGPTTAVVNPHLRGSMGPAAYTRDRPGSQPVPDLHLAARAPAHQLYRATSAPDQLGPPPQQQQQRSTSHDQLGPLQHRPVHLLQSRPQGGGVSLNNGAYMHSSPGAHVRLPSIAARGSTAAAADASAPRCLDFAAPRVPPQCTIVRQAGFTQLAAAGVSNGSIRIRVGEALASAPLRVTPSAPPASFSQSFFPPQQQSPTLYDGSSPFSAAQINALSAGASIDYMMGSSHTAKLGASQSLNLDLPHDFIVSQFGSASATSSARPTESRGSQLQRLGSSGSVLARAASSGGAWAPQMKPTSHLPRLPRPAVAVPRTTTR